MITAFYDPKPIDNRNYDWSATQEGYEPGDPVGYGATEEEAVADLKDFLERNE